MTESAPSVQELIKSISDKLAANRELIAKAKSGRLDWRWDKKLERWISKYTPNFRLHQTIHQYSLGAAQRLPASLEQEMRDLFFLCLNQDPILVNLRFASPNSKPIGKPVREHWHGINFGCSFYRVCKPIQRMGLIAFSYGDVLRLCFD